LGVRPCERVRRQFSGSPSHSHAQTRASCCPLYRSFTSPPGSGAHSSDARLFARCPCLSWTYSGGTFLRRHRGLERFFLLALRRIFSRFVYFRLDPSFSFSVLREASEISDFPFLFFSLPPLSSLYPAVSTHGAFPSPFTGNRSPLFNASSLLPRTLSLSAGRPGAGDL